MGEDSAGTGVSRRGDPTICIDSRAAGLGDIVKQGCEEKEVTLGRR
jgi:hypothetical protein